MEEHKHQKQTKTKTETVDEYFCAFNATKQKTKTSRFSRNVMVALQYQRSVLMHLFLTEFVCNQSFFLHYFRHKIECNVRNPNFFSLSSEYFLAHIDIKVGFFQHYVVFLLFVVLLAVFFLKKKSMEISLRQNTVLPNCRSFSNLRDIKECM